MAYTINLTDGTIFAVIADGTINTTSSMTLVGQNYEDYGNLIDTNFIHLLENSSNSTAPTAPLVGQLWWDKTNRLLKIYNGSIFKVVGSTTASATAPTSNVTGDMWYDTSTGQIKVYNGVGWTVVGPLYTTAQGVSGAIPTTITDTITQSHVAVMLYVEDSIVGIISKDAAYTPGNAISGFTTIKPGVNLSTTYGALFQGTANNATYLNSLSSGQFLRSDANTTATGTLTVLNDTGLTVGSTQSLNIGAVAAGINIKNTTGGSNINLQVNVGGTNTTALTVSGADGKVYVPAVTVGTNDNSLASTAYVTSTVAAAKVSPAFTGVPTAPTATLGTNTTQLATTAFVQSAVNAGTGGLGTMASQNASSVAITGGTIDGVVAGLTGVSTAVTAATSTNNTQIATTAFVANKVADYAPAKDGTGATGSWAISISGSASSATTAGYITNSAYNGYGQRTVSTSSPTGGNNGDIWYKI